jgi:hypothetical protein
VDWTWGEAAVSAVVGLLSGAGTALVLSFVFGRRYQKMEDRLDALEERSKDQGKDIEKLTTDQGTMAKENNESWLELNRSLGQIEGMLNPGRSTQPPYPPPFPPRKSRP